jgi:hypothetical protein
VEQPHIKRRVKPGWIVLGGLGALAVVLLVGSFVRGGGATTPETGPESVPSAERAPAGVRIRVQVQNGTTERGLARRGTLFLRDRGYDVVETGNAAAADRGDSTLVIYRSGQKEWAERIAKAFGSARIEARPDTSRFLDITVILGASWRPPAKPFYP